MGTTKTPKHNHNDRALHPDTCPRCAWMTRNRDGLLEDTEPNTPDTYEIAAAILAYVSWKQLGRELGNQ